MNILNQIIGFIRTNKIDIYFDYIEQYSLVWMKIIFQAFPFILSSSSISFSHTLPDNFNIFFFLRLFYYSFIWEWLVSKQYLIRVLRWLLIYIFWRLDLSLKKWFLNICVLSSFKEIFSFCLKNKRNRHRYYSIF